MVFCGISTAILAVLPVGTKLGTDELEKEPKFPARKSLYFMLSSSFARFSLNLDKKLKICPFFSRVKRHFVSQAFGSKST